jgi:mannitol 2-dehydrogenase
MPQLNAASLSVIGSTLPVPTYDRRRSSGIVHIGVGGFHRAHQAMYLDELMQQDKADDWAVTGVGLLASDARMRDVMNAQDCLYTLLVKHPDGGVHPRVLGSIVDYLFALTIRQPCSCGWPTRRRGSCRSPSPRAVTTSTR